MLERAGGGSGNERGAGRAVKEQAHAFYPGHEVEAQDTMTIHTVIEGFHMPGRMHKNIRLCLV